MKFELKNSSLINISMESPLILCFCIKMVEFGMDLWSLVWILVWNL